MHHPFSSRTDTKSERVKLAEDPSALTNLGHMARDREVVEAKRGLQDLAERQTH